MKFTKMAVLLMALTSPFAVPIEAADPAASVPLELQQEARKCFGEGNQVYIWRDTTTALKTETHPFVGQVVIVGPFKALASPKSKGPVAFQPTWKLAAKGGQFGTTEIHEATLSGPGQSVTSTSVAAFLLIIKPEAKGPNSYAYFEGKGTISAFLIRPFTKDNPEPVRISNALTLTLDIDKKAIK